MYNVAAVFPASYYSFLNAWSNTTYYKVLLWQNPTLGTNFCIYQLLWLPQTQNYQ